MPVWRLRKRGPLQLVRRSGGSATGTYTDAGWDRDAALVSL
jgi:hypothetical protein